MVLPLHEFAGWPVCLFTGLPVSIIASISPVSVSLRALHLLCVIASEAKQSRLLRHSVPRNDTLKTLPLL